MNTPLTLAQAIRKGSVGLKPCLTHLIHPTDPLCGNPLYAAARAVGIDATPHNAPGWLWQLMDRFPELTLFPGGGKRDLSECIIDGFDMTGGDFDAVVRYVEGFLKLVEAEGVEQ